MGSQLASIHQYIITSALNPFSIFVEKLLCEKATHTRHTSTLLRISQWVPIRILFSANPYDINKGSVKITSLPYQSLTPEVKETLAGKMFSYSVINN